jgi:cell division protein ZapA (FtsZ GTPase activity inhibitor)
MPKSFEVNIGGRSYSLRGENESSVRNAAGLVDSHINRIKHRYRELPAPTLNVLAAVNIAEELYETKGQCDADREYLGNEIDKMTNYLSESLAKHR